MSIPLLFGALASNLDGVPMADLDWAQYDQIATFWIVILVAFVILMLITPRDKGPKNHGNGGPPMYPPRGHGPYGGYPW